MSGAGGLGAGSHGSLPFGSGFGLAVDFMRVVRLNAIDVTFIGIPKSFDRAAVDDALNPMNYALTRAPAGPFDSTLPLVQHVEEQSQTVMRVFLDAPLQASAAYILTVASSVESLTAIPMSPFCAFATIIGLIEGFVPRKLGIEEQRTDIANVPASATELAGTYQIGPTGDLVNHGGIAYLRKRILRRITTARGGFFHLPDYGFLEGLGQRITPALLGRMRSQSEAQIKNEPDVLDARVDVTQLSLSVIMVTIRVRTASGSFSINEQLDFGETV